jgi:hypothetical protein
MKSSNSMVPNASEYQQDFFVFAYISFMSHNNGVVINIRDKPMSKLIKSPPNDDESGVGGLKHTPCLVKPL